MNINDFPDHHEDGVSIRDGEALLSITFDGEARDTGERYGTMTTHENGEEIESCSVIIAKDGNVRQRSNDNFYRAVEMFNVIRKA